MPRAIQLSESERKSILGLQKKNCSHREIAKKINRLKTVVANFLKDPLKYGLGKRTGGRRKVDKRTKRHILRATTNKTISCSNISHDLNLKISRCTINRVIKTSNILKRKKKTFSTLNKATQRFKIKVGQRPYDLKWSMAQCDLVGREKV